MQGGAVKMSEIAKRRVIAREGTNWQPTEEQEQRAVFEWEILMEKQYPELAFLAHVPNGEYRPIATATRLKKTGVKRGFPDLILPVARGGFHGLFVEMKRRKGGRVSDEQKEWLDFLTEQMYRAVVCHGAEEACDEIYRYLTESEQ